MAIARSRGSEALILSTLQKRVDSGPLMRSSLNQIYAAIILLLHCVRTASSPDWKWLTPWRGGYLKQRPASNPAVVSDQSRLLALSLKQMASIVKMPGIAELRQDIWLWS
jgi:hypothetical protein